VVYPLGELLAGKRDAQLYSRTDTHWNQRGAYIAYLSLCKQLGHGNITLPVVDQVNVNWLEGPAPGDLGGKMTPPVVGRAVVADLAHQSGLLVFDNGVHNHGRVMIFDNNAGPDHSCVAFGESFTNHLLLFLKESFRRLVFVHSSMLISEIVERERPDVVLSLPVERFLVQVPSDQDGLERLAQVVEEKASRKQIQQGRRYLRNCPCASGVASQSQLGTVPW
jgi:hypothetical protein